MRAHFARPAAFSLVEVTLALGVAAFGLIAVFGLLPAGLNNTQTSIRQTAAGNIMVGIVSDLRQTPTANQIASATAAGNTILKAVSPRYGIDITQASAKGYLSDSGATTPATSGTNTPVSLANSSLNASSNYQVNITITPATAVPSTPPVRTATVAVIQITWPAAAATANAAGSIISFVALDRN
ncbi:MAG: hypothetical protein WCD79_00455 [Chthoniobacteraceae bacterium]